MLVNLEAIMLGLNEFTPGICHWYASSPESLAKIKSLEDF